MTDAPRVAVVGVECFERPVRLRLPFRFGHATVHAAPQAFVRATIALDDGTTAEGWAAELMIPKWFDKSPQRSNADNVDDLRRAVALAAAAYAGDAARRPAFGHAAAHHAAIHAAAARSGLNPLVASYGPALVDRAVLDALLLARGVALTDAIRVNLPGIDPALTPDLDRADIAASLAAAEQPARIALRHTVGLVDPIERADVRERPPDSLPVALAEIVECHRPRYFKLKLSGDPAADVLRLATIAPVLDRSGDYHVTLDGNEQYRDLAAVDDFFARIQREAACASLRSRVLYLEQPLPRDISLSTSVASGRFPVPLIVDEADATMDAFPRAYAAGYRGVSSKDCKGFYKSLLNAARCRKWNAGRAERAFLTGEDLTAQAGLAVQQDLALAAALGLRHVERNGHHYADGFAGQQATAPERDGFLAAQAGLYERDGDNVRLAIRDGELDLTSLAAPGFGTRFRPEAAWLAPMRAPDGPGPGPNATQP